MSRIFISYSHDDAHTTKKLAELLGKAYDGIWYDTSEIRGGDKWWEKIEKAIEDCNHFIFLISEASVKSEWCIKELEKALDLGKHIVPVKIRRSVEIPEELESLQQIEMIGDISADAIGGVFATLIRYSSATNLQEYTQAHRQADLKLLGELWPLITDDVMQHFEYEVQSHYMQHEFFQNTIEKYLRLRSKSSKIFINPKLEAAFSSFDTRLRKFLRENYHTTTRLGRREGYSEDYYISQYKLNKYSDRSPYLLNKYNEAIQILQDILYNYHDAIVKTIKYELPEFQF